MNVICVLMQGYQSDRRYFQRCFISGTRNLDTSHRIDCLQYYCGKKCLRKLRHEVMKNGFFSQRSVSTSMAELVFHFGYAMAFVLLILIYCIAGEFLIKEVRLLWTLYVYLCLLWIVMSRNIYFICTISESQFARCILWVSVVRHAIEVSKVPDYLYDSSAAPITTDCWKILRFFIE